MTSTGYMGKSILCLVQNNADKTEYIYLCVLYNRYKAIIASTVKITLFKTCDFDFYYNNTEQGSKRGIIVLGEKYFPLSRLKRAKLRTDNTENAITCNIDQRGTMEKKNAHPSACYRRQISLKLHFLYLFFTKILLLNFTAWILGSC